MVRCVLMLRNDSPSLVLSSAATAVSPILKGDMQMQIDFKALEQALAPIAEIGQGELTFDMGGTLVTMRVLLPAEELEVQRYASEALPAETDGDPNNAVDYLDRFRVGCLAHAIVVVGNLDFRDAVYIEMSESLDNGKSVKVPKVKALRNLVNRWSRALLTRAFRKYSDLLNQVEQKAEKAIEFKPSDRDAEIERLEVLLASLKTDKEREESKSREVFSMKMDAALEAEVVANKVASTLGVRGHSQSEPEPEPEAPREVAPAPARRTGPISPQQAAPPQERPAPQAQARQEGKAQPSDDGVNSSFVNADDDDSMNASMNAEHHRLVEMRRRAAQGQRPADEGSALERIHPQLNPQARRRPPHMDAADAEDELRLMDEGAHQAEQARHLGDKEGVPVYAMPAQDLEVPGNRGRPDKSTLDPSREAGGSKNPRFQSPSRKP